MTEEDPWAELPSRRDDLKPPPVPARTLLRRVAAGFVLVLGGAILLSAFVVAFFDVHRLVVYGVIVAGLAVCGLAFALYDWRRPELPLKELLPDDLELDD